MNPHNMHVCMLWNKALGPIWGRMLEEASGRVCIWVWEWGTYFARWQLTLSQTEGCHCIDLRAWAWLGSLSLGLQTERHDSYSLQVCFILVRQCF